MENNNNKKEFIERRKRDWYNQSGFFPEFKEEKIKPLPFLKQYARQVMAASLVLSDVISILVSFSLAITLRSILMGEFSTSLYSELLLFVFLFIFLYSLNGLYPGVGLSPVEEIEKLFVSTSTGFLILLAYTFFGKTSAIYSRLVLGLAWLLSLILVQMDRWVIRITGRDLGFWGEPVIVIGNGPIGQNIFKFLKNNARLGMTPYKLLSGKDPYDRTTLRSINKSKISTIILVIPEMSERLQSSFIYEQRYGFYRRKGEMGVPRLILISSLSWIGSLGITVHDLDGMMGLEIQQNLLLKRNQISKRLIDLIIIFSVGLVSLPILGLIALLIAIDSPGGVFYKQERIGREGKPFKMWKFRTMYKNADQILEKYLADDPLMKEEWQKKQKIKDDPRITRVGKIIRKFSLDELPQIINVFKGEMSVSGPRPFFENQRKLYGSSLNLYMRVRPGLTGMWQVLGRNNLDFQERVRLDEYYIRNWSLWLEIYIFLRTFWVIITHEGAY